jgi:Vanin C-terminal domain
VGARESRKFARGQQRPLAQLQRSGIYQGGGEVLASQFNPTHTGVSRLLTADVMSPPPHHQTSVLRRSRISPARLAVPAPRSDLQHRHRIRANEGSVVVFDALPGSHDLVKVSNNGLACSASYFVSKGARPPYSRYALFAYRGNFRGELVEEICAVTRCALPAPYCVGWTTEAKTDFEELAVGGYFAKKGLRFELLGVDGAKLAHAESLAPYYDGVKLNQTGAAGRLAVLNLAVFNYPDVHVFPPPASWASIGENSTKRVVK